MNFNPVAEVARILELASENSGRSPLQTLTDKFTGDFNEFPISNATAPARNEYRFARTVTDLGFTWQLRPNTQLFWDISNLTNEPQAFYRYIPSQRNVTKINGTTWTMGINGRF
ncbi:MAG: hypothetical protein EXS27_11650 [Pedosphaera sp.]|nr:hypothetical protein [Pedosphaera sp.]